MRTIRQIATVVFIAGLSGLWGYAAYATSVPMEEEGGGYVVPVTINDVLSLRFQVDSGASVVVVPADVVITLLRTRTVREQDFIGTRTYVLADGSSVPSRIFRIRSLKVGNVSVQDVTAAVGDVRGGLLLGQTFLKRFKSWSIDNAHHSLVLSGPVSAPEPLPANVTPSRTLPMEDAGSNRLGHRSNSGLTGSERTAFVNAAIASCSEKQRNAPANHGISTSTISKFCTCYSNRVADNIDPSEMPRLEAGDDAYMREVLQTRIDEATHACASQVRDLDG